MSLILGMDYIVFIAWIGTILSTIFCIIYGIYYQFFKKNTNDNTLKTKDKNIHNKEVD